MRFEGYVRNAIVAAGLQAVAMATPATADDFYSHNGSIMKLTDRGGSITITYHDPKGSLSRLGIGPGTVLFEGGYSGRGLAGTAYVFRSGCRPAGYSVEGPITATGIYLKGASPVRRKGSCAVSDYTWNSGNAELNFHN